MLKIQVLHNDQIKSGNFTDLGSRHTTVWLDAIDPPRDDLEAIAKHIGGRPEEVEDLLDKNQRPVLHDIGQFTAVVFHAPEIRQNFLAITPYLLLASKEQKDFLSLHRGPSEVLAKVKNYPLHRQLQLFQKGSTALLYAALSEMVAQGFAVVNFLSEEIAGLEEQVFSAKVSAVVMPRIFAIKKHLIYFQRVLASDREVISEIEKAYGKFLDKRELSNFRLLYSDMTQLIELSATYRDVIVSTVEVHLAAISNNLNTVMKKLTALAAIILVPSLIAGIYGMNFKWLPVSAHPQGFWYMLGLMAVSVIGLYRYFKSNNWI